LNPRAATECRPYKVQSSKFKVQSSKTKDKNQKAETDFAMFCPTCGAEDRQQTQYCRVCGTDLRAVRITLEKPDAVTASAVSAREQISRAVADRIRQLESSSDIGQIAEVLLPQMEKFLESPEEKRLRRMREGIVTASVGLGACVLIFLFSLAKHDFLPFIGLGFVTFFIGLGILINGYALTISRRGSPKTPEGAQQNLLDPASKSAQLFAANSGSETNQLEADNRPSVTEHTTHQLKQNL